MRKLERRRGEGGEGEGEGGDESLKRVKKRKYMKKHQENMTCLFLSFFAFFEPFCIL